MAPRTSRRRHFGLPGVPHGLALLFFMACAVAPAPPQSGFLENYDGFKPDPADASLVWWERPGFNWSDYHGVLLDPVSVYYHPEARGRGIRPEELKKLTDAFRDAVIEELGTDYPVVAQAAAGILRIRCAITDIIPSSPGINLATSLLAFVAVDVGGASIEFEILDSMTGERLAAGVDQKLGSSVDGLANLTRLGQARPAFRDWAA
jgi:hypothetical protein